MAEKKEFPMSQDEYNKLREQIDFLKNDKRKEIAEKINQARGYGDISENSEYDSAKAEQAENEEYIRELDEMFKFAVIIEDDKIDYTTVSVGVIVKIFDYDMDSEVKYLITGSRGADPFKNKISNESPIARAIIGHKIGEEVYVESPGGSFKVKILEIEKKS